MHMLKMKRLIVCILSLFCLVIVLAGSFLYFLNISDYSQWISQQIKQTTGYDIRFEVVENNWLTENQFSVLGLSLYQQNKPIVYIDRLDLEIQNLDFWSRQLQIKNLHLKGVKLDINTSLALSERQLLNNSEDQKTSPLSVNSQSINWQKLQLSHIKITDLNANIEHLDKKISVKGANFDINDVLVIDQQQFIKFPQPSGFSTYISHLSFKDESLNTQLQELALSAQGSLLTQQAEVDFSVSELYLKNEQYPAVLLNSLLAQINLNGNTVLLDHFSVKAFSGELAAQAEALLAINLLPKADVKIVKIQLNSLNAKDMKIVIADFPFHNQQTEISKEQILLPIESLLIKDMNFQNMSLRSDHEKWPLIIKSADLQVDNFQVIKDNRFWNIDSGAFQTGTFSVAFSELNWQDTIIEQFSLAGNLENNKEDLGVLKQLLD